VSGSGGPADFFRSDCLGGNKRQWNGDKNYVRQTVEIALSSLLNGLKHKPELEFNLHEVGYGPSKANNLEKIKVLKRA